jgi:chloramphenicol 3-O phosphotransferase
VNGRIIFLNGTSSAGKSTLAKALRLKLDHGFCYYASDQLADSGFRPSEPVARSAGRERFFDGFHRSLAAFAAAGIDLLVEHIVEQQSWADDLERLLAPFDVFWIGVHASIDALDQREKARNDRRIGEARCHLKTHSFCTYDVEVDSAQPLDQNVDLIVNAWSARRPRGAV